MHGSRIHFQLVNDQTTKIEASYYGSPRKGSGRKPEARLGREFIRQWLNGKDRFFIANDGKKLFAGKPNGVDDIDQIDKLGSSSAKLLSTQTILKRARMISGPAQQRQSTTTVWRRSPVITEAALRRAEGNCEKPGCTYEPFIKADGAPYFEVHYIVPLSEDGEDSLDNVAALCPKCHREQHHSIEADNKRALLLSAIAEKNAGNE